MPRTAYDPKPGSILDRFTPWVVVAIGLVVIAYAYPLYTHLSMERFGSPGWLTRMLTFIGLTSMSVSQRTGKKRGRS